MEKELFNVVIKCFDDEEYEEVVTKEPVKFRQAVAIERGIEINLGDDYFTQIIETE